MTEGFLGVSWFAWAGVAAVVGAVLTVVQIPKQTWQATGMTRVVLRWFHSIAWLLLALCFAVRGMAPGLSSLADAVGLAGLGTYIAFRRVMSRTSEPVRVPNHRPPRSSRPATWGTAVLPQRRSRP